MEIIKCSRIADFSNTKRHYLNAHDIRILDVFLYNDKDKDTYHTHKQVTEVLFVIEGNISVKIKENNNINEIIINSGNIIIFSPGEFHCVKALKNNARIIVFKYLKTNLELLEIFASDWESE